MSLTKASYSMVTGAPVNVMDFGAIGNGVTDDTNAINAAIASVSVIGGANGAYGGEIYFPHGVYLISSTIVLPAYRALKLFGAGNGSENNGYSATKINKSASLNGEVFQLTTDASSVENMTIQGLAGNGGDGILIKASRCSLYNVSVFSMGRDGIRIGTDAGGENCNLWYLENVKAKSNTRDGIRISEGAGALADANAGTLVNPDLSNNGASGLYLGGTQLNTFVGGAYQANGYAGIHFSPYAQYNCVFGGDMEANVDSQIRIDTGAQYNSITCLTLLISGFSIGATTEHNSIQCIDFNGLICGITFPIIQVPSANVNTLDDYAEVAFTPTIIGTSTAGVGTYTSQVGVYTKIGRVVTFNINITWTAHTGTGNTQITGLPSSANTADTYTVVQISQSGGPVPGAGQQRIALIQPGTTVIQLRELNPATNVVSNSNAITATGTVYISGSYITAT
jgi:hypothetical protein